MSSHLRCRAPSLFLRVLPYALLFGLTSGCVAAADRMVDFSDSIRAMPDDAYIGGMPPAVSEVARRVRQRMQADRGGALPECRPPGPGQGLVVATDVGLVPDPSKTQTQTVLAELQSLLTSERPFVRDAAAFIVGEIGPAASSLAPDLNGHDIHRSLWFSHALGRISCQSYAMSRTLELVPEAARVKLLGAVRGSGATHSDLRLVARLLEFPELRWPDQFFSNVIEDGNDIGRLEKEPQSGPSVRIIADHIADEALSRPLRLDLLNLLRQLGHSAKPAADTLWVLANATDDDLAIAAASALVETGSERSVDAGKELLVRFNYGPSALPEELCSMKRAAEVLGPVLRKRLDGTSWADAAETIKMLGCIDPIGNASVARRLLTHPSWEVQLAAIEALKKSAGSDQETRTSLEAIQVSHWSGLVRKAAAEALAPPASGGPDSDSQEQFFFFKCFHRCVTDHLRQCGNDEGVVDGVYVSPTMGEWLTYLRNRAAYVSNGSTILPDENYAREVMQLFSFGLIKRNLDYSPALVGGQPQPTYDNTIIAELARVFTGLVYDRTDYTNARFTNNTNVDEVAPMICFPMQNPPSSTLYMVGGTTYHDNAAKTIFDGVSLPAVANSRTGCETDLGRALDAIANHASVAPFISRQLIQKFVTSNPSPAYIQRVATVFNNNGSGVRGDLAAVIRAVLMDTEARSNPTGNFGKLREPVLRMTAGWRALDVIERRERVTAGHLADEIGLTSGATTTLIDRLERRGYVRRVRDDADRRRVHVELTDRARAEAAVIWGPMAREAATLLGRSSPEDIAAVLAFLRHSRGVLEHHARRVRALGPPEEISASP